MNTTEFGLRIKTLRLELNLTQQQLADMMKVSNKAISKWENGEGYPDIENLKRISQIFGVTIDSLLENENEGYQAPEVYVKSKKDWIVMILSSTPFLLYFMPFYKVEIPLGWDTSIFEPVPSFTDTAFTISIRGYRAIADGFAYFKFLNILTSATLLSLLVISIMLIYSVYKNGILPLYKKSLLTFSGVSLSSILVIALFLFTLSEGFTITITPIILVAVYGMIALIIKTA